MQVTLEDFLRGTWTEGQKTKSKSEEGGEIRTGIIGQGGVGTEIT